MADNKTIVLLVAGGAGLAIYFATRKKALAATAASIATSAGEPTPPPSMTEVLTGALTKTVTSYMKKAAELDARIKVRSPKHYAAWQAAVKRGDKVYDDGYNCYVTATGFITSKTDCPVLHLAGYR